MLNMTSYRLLNNSDRYVVKLSNYLFCTTTTVEQKNEESRWLYLGMKANAVL